MNEYVTWLVVRYKSIKTMIKQYPQPTEEEMVAFFEERKRIEAELVMRYPYHLTIENGEILTIEEQYIP